MKNSKKEFGESDELDTCDFPYILMNDLITKYSNNLPKLNVRNH